MASAIEQLASHLSWRSFSKARELRKRIWFTLIVLIVYRLGTYIPLPGINPEVMGELAQKNASGILGMLDMFSGGSLGRMTIMTLNLMPYISASIIIQLMTAIFPTFEALKKEGDSGRKKLTQYTRYGTVLLASIQAYAIAVGLEQMNGSLGPVVLEGGFFFRSLSVVTLVGATLFLMWLGERVTDQGIGNGSSMIIYAGIVANLPQSALRTLEMGRTGVVPLLIIVMILVVIVLIITFIVFMERAYRKILIQYPARQVGQKKMFAGQSSHLPIKLNSAGVIPPIFAGSLLLLPATVANFSVAGYDGGGWLSFIARNLSHGTLIFMLLYLSLIIFFSFFYTSIVFNPDETAENLRRNGGFIPGYRPGKVTSQYFEYVLNRLTVLGSAYLSFICILPEILMSQVTLSFYLGGTSLLIVVSVTMETISQVHSHLITHQYEGLVKKFRFRKIDRG